MEQAKHEVGEAGQIPRGSSTASAQDVEDLKTEVRMLRKELQTLNACFNTSAGKLSALMQQQSQAGERLSEQGQQIQHICSLLEEQDGRCRTAIKQPYDKLNAHGPANGSVGASLQPFKRKKTEQEKEAAREVVARQRAAEQLKERTDSGHPVPTLQPGMVAKVYPGTHGTPQWTGNWEGQFTTLCDYPSILSIWQEWETGILYKDGLQRTVPLAQLEEDLAFKRSIWRRSKKLRNRLHAMKTIIYHLLRQSSAQSRGVGDVLTELDAELIAQVAENKSQKAICTLALEKIKAEADGWMKPSQFETAFLGWPAYNERKKANPSAAAISLQQAMSDSDS